MCKRKIPCKMLIQPVFFSPHSSSIAFHNHHIPAITTVIYMYIYNSHLYKIYYIHTFMRAILENVSTNQSQQERQVYPAPGWKPHPIHFPGHIRSNLFENTFSQSFWKTPEIWVVEWKRKYAQRGETIGKNCIFFVYISMCLRVFVTMGANYFEIWCW